MAWFVTLQRNLLTGRQTLSIHVPGDIPDLQGLHLRTMDHTLASIGRGQVALIAHRDLLKVLARSPRLAIYFGVKVWLMQRSRARGSRNWGATTR